MLDACRYDVFKQVNWLDGDLQKRTSKGSTSIEFLNRNFRDYYGDIVYISGNAFVNPSKTKNDRYQRKAFNSNKHFYDVLPVFMDVEGRASPKDMNKALRKAEEKYPEKRKIINYVQPHLPLDARNDLPDDPNYHDLRRKGLDKDQLREGYADNLKYVLEHVEDIIED